MKLKLQTPTRVVVEESVTKVSAEGEHGHFTLLPRHIDFLAGLLPGLLSFQPDTGQEEVFVAVDEGLLVKRGSEVLVSVRQATRGEQLDRLRRKVREEFAAADEREQAAQAATAKLEASFRRRYLEFAEEQA